MEKDVLFRALRIRKMILCVNGILAISQNVCRIACTIFSALLLRFLNQLDDDIVRSLEKCHFAVRGSRWRSCEGEVLTSQFGIARVQILYFQTHMVKPEDCAGSGGGYLLPVAGHPKENRSPRQINIRPVRGPEFPERDELSAQGLCEKIDHFSQVAANQMKMMKPILHDNPLALI